MNTTYERLESQERLNHAAAAKLEAETRLINAQAKLTEVQAQPAQSLKGFLYTIDRDKTAEPAEPCTPLLGGPLSGNAWEIAKLLTKAYPSNIITLEKHRGGNYTVSINVPPAELALSS